MLRLLMDVHVPRAITVTLRSRGIDVVTAQEDGADRLDDEALLDRTGQLQRVLFTQDDDFLRISASRQRAGIQFLGVIYAVQSPRHLGQYIEDLYCAAAAMDEAEMMNRLLYLPL